VAAWAGQEREHTLSQLLVSLDGFGAKSRVVVIAATNRADVLDPALLRPGRFGVRIAFTPPSIDDRLEILAIHTRGKPLAKGLDLRTLVDRTPDFTGAELEQLCNGAALLATRRARREGRPAPELELRDFQDALAERAGPVARFDKLDAIVIESTSQLSQPTGRVVVRVVLEDGEQIEGDVVWVDSSFAKIRSADGKSVVVSKAQIRKMEALAGTEAHTGDIVQNPWAGQHPDVA